MTRKPDHFLTKTPRAVPGSLQRRWVRCGSPTCRCASGDLHGPYWRRFFREGGRTVSTYVPLGAVAQTRLATLRWRRDHPSRRALLRELRGLSRLMEG